MPSSSLSPSPVMATYPPLKGSRTSSSSASSHGILKLPPSTSAAAPSFVGPTSLADLYNARHARETNPSAQPGPASRPNRSRSKHWTASSLADLYNHLHDEQRSSSSASSQESPSHPAQQKIARPARRRSPEVVSLLDSDSDSEEQTHATPPLHTKMLETGPPLPTSSRESLDASAVSTNVADDSQNPTASSSQSVYVVRSPVRRRPLLGSGPSLSTYASTSEEDELEDDSVPKPSRRLSSQELSQTPPLTPFRLASDDELSSKARSSMAPDGYGSSLDPNASLSASPRDSPIPDAPAASARQSSPMRETLDESTSLELPHLAAAPRAPLSLVTAIPSSSPDASTISPRFNARPSNIVAVNDSDSEQEFISPHRPSAEESLSSISENLTNHVTPHRPSSPPQSKTTSRELLPSSSVDAARNVQPNIAVADESPDVIEDGKAASSASVSKEPTKDRRDLQSENEALRPTASNNSDGTRPVDLHLSGTIHDVQEGSASAPQKVSLPIDAPPIRPPSPQKSPNAGLRRYPKRARPVLNYNIIQTFEEHFAQALQRSAEAPSRVRVAPESAVAKRNIQPVSYPVVEAQPAFFDALRARSSRQSRPGASRADPVPFVQYVTAQLNKSATNEAQPSAQWSESQVARALARPVGPTSVFQLSIKSRDGALGQLQSRTRRWLGVHGINPYTSSTPLDHKTKMSTAPFADSIEPSRTLRDIVSDTFDRPFASNKLDRAVASLKSPLHVIRDSEAETIDSALRRLRLGRQCKLPLPNSLRFLVDMEQAEMKRLEDTLDDAGRDADEDRARKRGQILIDADPGKWSRATHHPDGRKQSVSMQCTLGGTIRVVFKHLQPESSGAPIPKVTEVSPSDKGAPTTSFLQHIGHETEAAAVTEAQVAKTQQNRDSSEKLRAVTQPEAKAMAKHLALRHHEGAKTNSKPTVEVPYINLSESTPELSSVPSLEVLIPTSRDTDAESDRSDTARFDGQASVKSTNVIVEIPSSSATDDGSSNTKDAEQRTKEVKSANLAEDDLASPSSGLRSSENRQHDKTMAGRRTTEHDHTSRESPATKSTSTTKRPRRDLFDYFDKEPTQISVAPVSKSRAIPIVDPSDDSDGGSRPDAGLSRKALGKRRMRSSSPIEEPKIMLNSVAHGNNQLSIQKSGGDPFIEAARQGDVEKKRPTVERRGPSREGDASSNADENKNGQPAQSSTRQRHSTAVMLANSSDDQRDGSSNELEKSESRAVKGRRKRPLFLLSTSSEGDDDDAGAAHARAKRRHDSAHRAKPPAASKALESSSDDDADMIASTHHRSRLKRVKTLHDRSSNSRRNQSDRDTDSTAAISVVIEDPNADTSEEGDSDREHRRRVERRSHKASLADGLSRRHTNKHKSKSKGEEDSVSRRHHHAKASSRRFDAERGQDEEHENDLSRVRQSQDASPSKGGWIGVNSWYQTRDAFSPTPAGAQDRHARQSQQKLGSYFSSSSDTTSSRAKRLGPNMAKRTRRE
ncbi:hypothetical protein BCV70DRAFT_196817 [Testicularia cyperi]|uniref:Uncharacterized protein n=1 Tax=Testicularia cyperi TaxID=1882483 RepID=A0A317XXB2_9BASI|nr:hypothetical protein BCV70DRAFT_196817 [Testicularia cyperi]